MSDVVAVACIVSTLILLVTLILTVAVLHEGAADRRHQHERWPK